MEVVYRKRGDLVPYENNPRKNDGAVDAVAASIKEFGWKVPVIIDKDNVVVAGHTRLKAAEKLGIEDIPCIVADDLTDDQLKAFRLADNKVSEFSSWDYDKLRAEIADLDLDMGQFGISLTDVPDFSDYFSEADEKEKKPKQYTCPCCGRTFEL